MLYHLLFPLAEDFGLFNVFRYITFRTAGAVVTALVLSLVLGPWFIRKLRRLQVGQNIRELGPRAHQVKAGTPTMGGLLILFAVIGASANVIVAGFAERSGHPISFAGFMLRAFPLMLLSIAISSVYIYLRYLG